MEVIVAPPTMQSTQSIATLGNVLRVKPSL